MSPLGNWNTEYWPFFIQITEIPSKKWANTEYRHILRPPPSPPMGRETPLDSILS